MRLNRTSQCNILGSPHQMQRKLTRLLSLCGAAVLGSWCVLGIGLSALLNGPIAVDIVVLTSGIAVSAMGAGALLASALAARQRRVTTHSSEGVGEEIIHFRSAHSVSALHSYVAMPLSGSALN